MSDFDDSQNYNPGQDDGEDMSTSENEDGAGDDDSEFLPSQEQGNDDCWS